jgi:hypothetical protein
MKIQGTVIFTISLSTLLLLGCDKNNYDLLPQVTTLAIYDTTGINTMSGGNIKRAGGSKIIQKGVVWSTITNPIIEINNKTLEGIDIGVFNSSIQGLSPNTKYFLRAYATNKYGTSYGQELIFKTNNINLKSGLVGFYPFTGNALDSSGYENHGTVFGATLASDRFNEKNKAYSFDGKSSYIKCLRAGLSGNPRISISFWVNTSINGLGEIIGWGAEGISGADLRVQINDKSGCTNGNNIAFDTYNNVVRKTAPITLNKWEHVVLIYDGRTSTNILSTKIYKNNSELMSTCFSKIVSTTNISTKFPIVFGKYHGTIQNNFFSGLMDDIRIYNRILEPSEIKYLSTH